MTSNADQGSFLITSDNVSGELLRDILERAGVDAALDEDGDVVFESDGFKTFLQVAANRTTVRVWVAFNVASGVSPERQYEFANAWNVKFELVRAVAAMGLIAFDDYVVVGGGCTVDHFLFALTRFFNVVVELPGFNTDGVLA